MPVFGTSVGYEAICLPRVAQSQIGRITAVFEDESE